MSYPNVALQYRECTPTQSRHLFVHPDGSYTIDHIDDYNPDLGHSLHHFVFDLIPYAMGR